ncbi:MULTISPECIES: VOC family protein [unclassified Rhodococcus (in: high G+C Gram-positive bacteria)]|uniref:VOC family protein n=1 Tax=unclassified Rhodococcus (in: high G+C Gram-positive bacteria) TaxID=192944 RepID=UPI001639E4FE|nr:MULTISPECIES: VOC family protein [unclassified Rhodococcus (in: high G+C Gram-positive bacteria)]MBC2644495.1 VOC family protein [Rhodococcus sp. 3A]MBC2897817.1 VOC family protein [Rhodococcus sp. 4CII]
MKPSRVNAVVAVVDVDVDVAWYTTFFGRPADRHLPDLAEWRITGDVALQLVLDPYGAGSSMVALEVDGMVGVLADLEHHDIIPETIIDGTATITDPAGNRVRITALNP